MHNIFHIVHIFCSIIYDIKYTKKVETSASTQEIGKLAEDSEKTVNQIQGVTQVVLESVENLASSSSETLEFIDKQVKNDYNSMVEVGEKYNTSV